MLRVRERSICEIASKWDLQSPSEGILGLGDFDGHAGRRIDSFECVHGGYRIFTSLRLLLYPYYAFFSSVLPSRLHTLTYLAVTPFLYYQATMGRGLISSADVKQQ